MSKIKDSALIADIINGAKKLVIIQADNPDGDSLSSALVLEEILSDLGKDVSLYCGVDIPSYLSYLPGWDRVVKELPPKFDASIIVDVGNEILLEQLEATKQKAYLRSRPSIMIDHHSTKNDLTWVSAAYLRTAVSTTELIYDLAMTLDWKLSQKAKEMVVTGILSDSLGFTIESTTAHSLRVTADLVEGGVNMAKLENARRSTMGRSAELVHYKGRLLQRVEYHAAGRVAVLTIPWEEIEKYSPLYNPSTLAIDDMRLTTGTAIAICFKLYPDGKVTAKIRCNFGFPVGDKLGESFGGGGHPYAAGLKVTGKDFKLLKEEVISRAAELLDKLPLREKADEAV